MIPSLGPRTPALLCQPPRRERSTDSRRRPPPKARKRAQAGGSAIPPEAPTLGVIQRRIDGISARLNIPRRDALWTGTVM